MVADNEFTRAPARPKSAVGQGKQLYDERKRIKMENDIRMEQSHNDRLRREALADEIVELAMKAARDFLSGKAAIIVTPGHEAGAKVISFQMPTPI